MSHRHRPGQLDLKETDAPSELRALLQRAGATILEMALVGLVGLGHTQRSGQNTRFSMFLVGRI